MQFLSIIKPALILVLLMAIYSCSDDEPIDCTTGNLTATINDVNDASCGLSNGSFELIVSGGISPFEFSLAGSDYQNVQNGINLIESVPPGNYNLTVSDLNGCTTSVTVNILNQNNLSASISVTASGCETADGTITVNASGGMEPYSYRLDGGTVQAENTFLGLMKGDYTTLITDKNGCQTSVTISVLSGTSYKNDIIPIINADCAISNCHDGSNTALPDWTSLITVQSLAETIKNRTSNGTMPRPGTPGLNPSEIQSIACWVDDGALNN